VPWELAATAAVLLVTALLTTTAPPSTSPAAGAERVSQPAGEVEVALPLEGGRSATVEVTPPHTGRSRLVVEVRTAGGSPLALSGVTLRATLEDRDLGPFPIRLRERGERLVGGFRFPLAGTWKLILTVQDQDRNGTVTTGEVTITPPPEGTP
jgi:copper transport protein